MKINWSRDVGHVMFDWRQVMTTAVQRYDRTRCLINFLPLVFCTINPESSNFYIIDYNRFWKIHCFNCFPYKSKGDQIWPCRKIGQSQLRVISWTNLIVLKYPMLHTNFQGHRPFGSREKEYFSWFYYIWAWRPSWSSDLDHLNKLLFPHPIEAVHEIWLQSA